MTSRDIGRVRVAVARVEGVEALTIATVGLGNAERIGTRRPAALGAGFGTINISAQILGAGLTETAQIEALTIAAQARTAAVIEAGIPLDTGLATGTDCIAVAALAGLHTALGEALGAAVYDCVSAGAREWIQEQGKSE